MDGLFEIAFRVDAVPVAQPRPRAVMRGRHAGVMEADKSHPIHAFKASVRMAFCAVHEGPPVDDCDLVLTIVFVMPRTQDCAKYGTGRVPYRVKRNDWDNLGKAVSDALNQLAWTDDGLIHAAYVERWYAAQDEKAHCDITIRRLDDPVKLASSRKRKPEAGIELFPAEAAS